MRIAGIIVTALVIVVTQVGLVNSFGPWRPDMVLMFLGAGVFLFSIRELASATLASALVFELSSSLPFGIVGGSLCVAILFLYLLRRFFFIEGYWMPIALSVALGVLFFHSVGYILNEAFVFFGLHGVALEYFVMRLMRVTIPILIVSTLSASVLLLFFYKIIVRRT